MLALFNDARVSKWFTNGYVAPFGPGQFGWNDIVKAWTGKGIPLSLIITLKPDTEGVAKDGRGSFIGFIVVRMTNEKNREGDIGPIGILPEHWSKGYGTEALAFVVDYCFRAMALHRVSLNYWEGNERAAKAYIKA